MQAMCSLLQWIDQVKDPAPQQIFVVHGDAQVTEIFAVQLPTENGADMEKAINEQVKRLKRTKIDHLTANAATVEEIQRLVDAKRKLDSLYITI